MSTDLPNTVIGSFPRLSAADLSVVRSRLIDKRNLNSPDMKVRFQTELAEAAGSENPSDFVMWWAKNATEDGEFEKLRFPEKKFTEAQVSNPPENTEKSHFERLEDLPPNVAALPSFWVSYQLEMIRRGLLEPSWLAAKPSSSEEGRKLLQKALRQKNFSQLDSCIRTILRQLGGLPEERGKVSVFMDCRISRAWWRGYICKQVVKDSKHEPDAVWQLLRRPRAPWDVFVQYSVRKLTVVNDRPVRSAIFDHLIETMKDLSSDDRMRATRKTLDAIGRCSAAQLLGALSVEENKLIINGIRV